MSLSAPQALYAAAGYPTGILRDPPVLCTLCGGPAACWAVSWAGWVKPTFTDHDKRRGGPGDWLCPACVWAADDRNPDLTARTAREKPQRMRNYSHLVTADGAWHPLSKTAPDRAVLRAALLTAPFPPVVVVALSGQKHLIFRARVNPPGATAGWVQLEEATVWIDPGRLDRLLTAVAILYGEGASKAEIGSGQYRLATLRRWADRLPQFWATEAAIRPQRGTPTLTLALFLAQREEALDGHTDRGSAPGGSGIALAPVAGDPRRLQEPLPGDDLAAI